MNRREMFKRVMCVAVGAGVAKSDVVASTVSTRPALAVFEIDAEIDYEGASCIRKEWLTSTKNTPLEGVPVVVLGVGAKLILLGADGHVLNEPVPLEDV